VKAKRPAVRSASSRGNDVAAACGMDAVDFCLLANRIDHDESSQCRGQSWSESNAFASGVAGNNLI